MEKRYTCLYCQDYVSDDWTEVKKHIIDKHGIEDGRLHLLIVEIPLVDGDPTLPDYLAGFSVKSKDRPSAKVELVEGKPGVLRAGGPKGELDRLETLFLTGKKWKRRGGPTPTPEKDKVKIVQGWRKAKGKVTQDAYADGQWITARTLRKWERELEEEGKL